MAFKMAGAPYKKGGKTTGKVVKRDFNKEEKIIDLEDKIEFINEDIFNADGKMTPTQRVNLSKYKQELRAIKKG